MNAHQPLPEALIAVRVEDLDGDGLGAKAQPALVVDEALVHRPEPALPEEVDGREVAGHEPELGECEDVKIRREFGAREVA